MMTDNQANTGQAVPTAAPPALVAPPAPNNPRGLLRPQIPCLTGITLSTFGRRDNRYRTLDYAIQIAGQDTVATSTYHQMTQICNSILPITVVEFTRMWKTLILKRTQDVYEKEKHNRADHFVRLDRSILTPAPLSDLLYSIGQFVSQSIGMQFHVTPPAHAAEPPNWWTVDAAILSNWNLLCNRMKKMYLMREFPSPSDYDGRPLVLTNIHDQGDFRSVSSYTNEPTPSDAFVRLVNDELFVPANAITYDTSSYLLVDSLHRQSVVGNYVGSYVLESNS